MKEYTLVTDRPKPNRFVGTVFSADADASLSFVLSAFRAIGYDPRETTRKNVVEYAIIRFLREIVASPDFREKYKATFGVVPELPAELPGEQEFAKTFGFLETESR